MSTEAAADPGEPVEPMEAVQVENSMEFVDFGSKNGGNIGENDKEPLPTLTKMSPVKDTASNNPSQSAELSSGADEALRMEITECLKATSEKPLIDVSPKFGGDENSHVNGEYENKEGEGLLALDKKQRVLNTFYGGVRFFASAADDIVLSDVEENPFEPTKPCFPPVRAGRKSRLNDSGVRPFSLFGELENKLEEDDEDFAKSSKNAKGANPSKEDLDREKIDRILDETAKKPANFASLVARTTNQPKKRRGRQPNTTLVSTPVPKVNFKALSVEEQLMTDLKSKPFAFFNGARVFAKWVDKNFYPGNVMYNDGFGRFKIRFVDGEIRDVPAASIFSICQLKVNDEVMISMGPDELANGELVYQPSIIKRCPNDSDADEWHEGLFDVESKSAGEFLTLDDDIRKVSWEKFMIDAALTKKYVTPSPGSSSSGVISGNLSESSERRTRGIKRPKFVVDSSEEDGDFTYFDEDDEEEVAPKPRRRRKRQGVDEEDYVPSVNRSAGNNRTPAARNGTSSAVSRRSSTQTPQAASRVKAATPSSDTKSTPLAAARPKITETVLVIKPFNQNAQINRTMFSGMKFVLTSAAQRTKDNAKTEEDEVPAFNKRQIRHFIEERGGFIVEDFSSLPDVQNCFLVADTHYRTHKYLTALVRAVPCVSHAWIIECVKENAVVPHEKFMLNAGMSLESLQLVPWHDKCLTLLNGIKMYVGSAPKGDANSTSSNFSQIWSPIATCMGATLLDKLPENADDPSSKFDIFLTDSNCPDDIVAAAKALDATPVSSEWLIQAILTGVLPSTSGHPKYKHDFVEIVEATT